MTAPALILPAQDPFTALAAHFGMLLGVPDMQTLVGHGWAKHRLHNSWLHSQGVVWGMGLQVADDEVRVAPGLALAPPGHELYLPATSCLSLPAWRAEQDAALGTDRSAPFDAHVVARFRACLSREVPALASVCEGGGSATAYSRLSETVDLFLVAGRAERTADHYLRLRSFLTEAPTDASADPAPAPGSNAAADVAAAWTKVRSAVLADRPKARLQALRVLLAYDAIDRKRVPDSVFAGPEPDPLRPDDVAIGGVVLGELLGLRLAPDGEGRPIATVGEIDYASRPTQVDTLTIPELITGRLDPEPAGSGPRAVPGSARVEVTPPANAGDPATAIVKVTMSAPVLPGSVRRSSSVSILDATEGWLPVDVSAAGYVEPDITLTLTEPAPAGAAVRVLLLGTGPTPMIADLQGAAGVPATLAGLVGGLDVPAGQGADAVLLIPGETP